MKNRSIPHKTPFGSQRKGGVNKELLRGMLTIKYRSFSSLYVQLKHNTGERKDEKPNIRNREQETGEINKSSLKQISREAHKNSFQSSNIPFFIL